MMDKEQSNAPLSASSTPKSTADERRSSKATGSSIPSITLPKGGGAIQSIDSKFKVNAANGTTGFSIPFPFSPSRNGFMPSLTLGYNSGSGNGLFGLGWTAMPAVIERKTEKHLPEYDDEKAATGQLDDMFVLLKYIVD